MGPVAHGGHCVARYEGRVVFVRHALPGERVLARVTEGGEGSRFWRADAVQVIDAAAERVRPPCPYAGPGRCGGCDWQHATPAAQRALKAAVVAEQLRRLAGLDLTVEVEAVPGDPAGLGWRTRVTFAVASDGRLGLRRHRSHEVVPVHACAIAHPDVEAVGAEAHRWAGMSTVEVVSGADGEAAVVLRPVEGREPRRLPPLDPRVSVLVDQGPAGTRRVRGRSRLRERAAGRDWRVTAGGFWQVHPAAARTLVDAVLEALEPVAGDSALDLYSGVGLFAAALAPHLGEAGSVLAVEGDARAAGDARRNLHDLPNVRLLHAAVGRAVAGSDVPRCDLVVLDPPRTGAGREVVAALAGSGPRRVAYVACDPAALARDVAFFAEGGYRLERLRAFDLFPMTSHVECVAHLVKG